MFDRMIPLFFMFNENIFRNMANINKIRISGTSYDIQDLNAPSVSAVTQQEYDNLPSSAKTSNTFFVITDAQAGDLTNYYTKSETNTLLGGKADTATTYTKTEVDTALGGKADTATTYTKTEVDNAITAATSTKQDTLVSGTNIKTINNESILGSGNIDIQGGGGGGKAVTGGTNISVTTGETADTINCTLPISVGSSNSSISVGQDNGLGTSINSAAIGKGNSIGNIARNSLVVGENNKAGYNTSCAIAFGYGSSAITSYTFACGLYVIANNSRETSLGKYNASNTGSTTADNTLFSVGNGTADNARHNAFEIRQNGDIYLNDGTSDIKLQDYLQIKAVKLTQSEYDSLSTYDSNTLYVIVN